MDLTQALNVKAAEIERPPLPPVGHYVFKVAKPAVFDTVGQGMWDTIDFPMQAQEPYGEDVDPESLAEYGGPKMVNLRHRFMFPKEDTPERRAQFERTLYNMKRFLTEHLGIEEGKKDLKQLVDEAVGNICVAQVGWRPDENDPEVKYAEIAKTAPLT